MPLPGDELVTYNGTRMRVRDVPDRLLRAMWGYGHAAARGRVGRLIWRPGLWFYTPDTCQLAEAPSATRWVEDGQTLVCIGCGLDCT